MTRPCRVGLREAIIEASLAIGTEVGEAGVTMRRIGARLGVSATALYQHFESKEALLRELRLYGLMRLRETLEDGESVAATEEQGLLSAVDRTQGDEGAEMESKTARGPLNGNDWPEQAAAWQPTLWSSHTSSAGSLHEAPSSTSTPTPYERCALLAERYVHFGRANPWLYSILMEHADIDWKSATPQERGELLAPLRLAQASVEEALRAEPSLATVDAAAVSLQLWAGMHGLCSLLIHGRLSEDHPVFPVRDESAMIRGFVNQLLGAFIQGATRVPADETAASTRPIPAGPSQVATADSFAPALAATEAAATIRTPMATPTQGGQSEPLHALR